MPTGKKNAITPIIVPCGKGVDKVWRIEKKLRSMFQHWQSEEWPFGLNLGSIQDVARRADIARDILRRAIKRKRRTLTDSV
ncbi:MAG: hypothetical protein H7839_14065 [Magnetococcus sp. YQC-5]